MTIGRKVIHVELNVAYKGQKDWYFGSKKAVSQYLSKEQLGIKYSTLRNINLEKYDYENALCRIKQGILLTAYTPIHIDESNL